jgi:hypothetical protein
MYFDNIAHDLKMIFTRPITSVDHKSHKGLSLTGRWICVCHLIATPLKALSALGRLAIALSGIALLIFALLTLNAHPSLLFQVVANIIDISLGIVLLPMALIANIIRCAIGIILHPGAMIRNVDEKNIDQDALWNAKHNILAGTLVNY